MTLMLQTACHSLNIPFEDVLSRCPLRGMRSREFATGVFFDFFDNSARMSQSHVIMEGADATPESMQMVISEFSEGKTFMAQYLQLKLQCWKVLPWNLASLTSSDPNEVQQYAKKLLAEWEAAPKDKNLHHRLTWQLFGQQGSLEDTEEVVQDPAALQELKLLALSPAELSQAKHPCLWATAWKLAFLPTVERIQEADHGQVNLLVGRRDVSGPYVSCVLRLPELKALASNLTEWNAFLSQFSKITCVDELAKRLGFFHLPVWQQLQGQRLSDKKVMAAKVFYILDPESQFASLQRVRAKRAKHDAKKKKYRDIFMQEIGLVDRFSLISHFSLQTFLYPFLIWVPSLNALKSNPVVASCIGQCPSQAPGSKAPKPNLSHLRL